MASPPELPVPIVFSAVVRGFRCFPWMAVNFFLTDGFNVDASTLQQLLTSTYLPMLGKPFYGFVFDAVSIFGQHRVPYMAIGAFLQAFSWLAIAILPLSSISIRTTRLFLVLSSFGASIADVANDATVAEIGGQLTASSGNSQSSSSGELQSSLWIASSAGALIGNLLGCFTIRRLKPRAMFFIFGLVLALQFVMTICVRESSLNLPGSSSNVGIGNQLKQLSLALKRPEIAYSIVWLVASYAAIPTLTGTMFVYQTQYLRIGSTVLGISKFVGQVAMLVWSIICNRYFESVPARKLIAGIQAMMAVFMVSDVLFVKGAYRNMGVPDSFYVVVFSSILEFLSLSKILPFNVLMAQLCPRGCKGSLMVLVACAIDLSRIVSGYLGSALASSVGSTRNDFSGFPLGLLVQALCTLLPVYWSSCIPDERIFEARRRDE